MKRMKKLLILVLSTLMLLGTMGMPVFAASDSSVTVSGLDAGDTVKFYKLIKWESTGWAWADGVEAAATSAGVTLPDLETITGNDTTAGAISAANGGILAQVAQKLSPVDTETVATGASSVTYTKPSSMAADDFLGLYVALVKPATADYLYNPVFVSADFTAGNNSMGVQVDALSYSDTALAKKEHISLTKTCAETQYDVAVGDTIAFTITSTIPEYSTSYVHPAYEITDKMDADLELVPSSIAVKVGGATLAASNYDLTSSTTGFTVKLKEAYLKTLTEAKPIVVTYNAKVTKIDDNNVVIKENKATVKFSNDPSNSSGYGLLEDYTYHYVFSLDAECLGHSGYENSELVKIGLNPDGTPITEKTLDNGESAGVLEGAVFGLYTDPGCNTLYTNNNVTPAIDGRYTSDENGKLNISGLDAGTYYLREISAPEGYIADTTIYRIVITPKYKTVDERTYVNSDGITVYCDSYKVLESYTVVVTNMTSNQAVTSTFTITNDGPNEVSSTTDHSSFLKNTQGTELPTTGGMGTTIFYIIGTLLVIGAAIIIVTRRRMDSGR